MHTLLHLIGLCPDSISHFDLLDLITLGHTQFVHLFNYFFKH